MGKSRAKIFQIIFVLVTTGAALVWPQPSPLCRLGVISTPYLTSQTIEELGPKRNFLVRTGPAGLAEAFRLAKEEKLSSLIILGDLTWTGSEADFEKLKGLLEKAPVPVILVPGPRDLSGGQERFLKAFARYAASVRFSRQVNGVRLIFNGLPVEKVEEQTAFLDWLDKESTLAESPEAVLLFGQLGSFLRQPAGHQLELLQRFRLRCQENRVAAALTPGHSHTCELVSNLPVWSAPTAGWPGEGNALGIVTVFPERIELSLCRSQQPWQTLTVPNPVKTARFDPGKDPYLLPPYSQDLAEKPELTFVLSGDPQFDDLTVERHKSRFSAVVTMNRALVEELNRLKPELVFVAGDLTNKHTPAEWQLFQETYRQLKMPVYLVAGNHDRLPPKDFWGTGKLKDLEET
ncbi:MAG TPA: metallophosphoesterase, partial [bacterium]|nr:metallophosphoesterase [bacterium]